MATATILVTGAAGFIGFHLSRRLLADGFALVGFDNLNGYYDPALKRARLAQLQAHDGFRFEFGALETPGLIAAVFERHRPEIVVHLAAQAGVRHSLDQPLSYAESNLTGFITLVEACRRYPVRHCLYASSSSVYGANAKQPFAVGDPVDQPVSLYAATKRSNELMAHAYAHLFAIPMTGLRLFTVYGPWGRPDMAYYGFARKILAGEPIDVFNHGQSRRDFTYVDDCVEAIRRLIERPAPTGADTAAEPSATTAPYRLYNIGNDRPDSLMDLIGHIETALGRVADKRLMPLQPGDVVSTWADIGPLTRDTGFRPATPLKTGIERFIDWFRAYHRL